MAEITASMVRDLRDKTGAGMMDCKKALNETNGDIEQALDWLRKKGLAAVAKKSGRTASEGLVAVYTTGKQGVVLEVNSETDFVSRNELFQNFVAELAKTAINVNNVEALLAQEVKATKRLVKDELSHQIATIGENMVIRRLGVVGVKQGVIGQYIHNAVAEGLGKIGVIIALESEAPADVLHAAAKQIAMHIAATSPASLNVETVDPELVAREKAIFAEQAKASGKPDNIIEKMVEGRIRKFYEECVLLEQTFIIDGETKIKDVLKNLEKETGKAVTITGFVRFGLGEGIEKEEKDFAAEVAAQLAS